ncbi:MAG: glycosyltransferase family 39 protein [Candidatus Chisholmbacteria bacterium]|nr:glycosyltransferase family 39 protein [Candidatus Chisholmbacteria bacterium]
MKKNSLGLLLIIVILAAGLRFYKLGSFSPGLYSDEAAYGYNAYSLLTTGKDEYGTSWPLSLKSFGDYKPPMTAWLTIPSIIAFGLNEFAVRFPSALAGTLTVVVIYFLALELFSAKKDYTLNPRRYTLALLSALLLAISPWHLHFSRSSMLVGIEALFLSLGILWFLKATRNPFYLYVSAASFVAAIYTYYGSRVTVPLLVITLAIIFRQSLKRYRKEVIGSALLSLILLVPLGLAALRDPTTLTGRARTISIFYDPGIRLQLWQAHTLDGSETPVLISRFFHNKAYFYGREIVRRYLQHFSYEFLVSSGDPTPPFDIPHMGVIYGSTAIFFVVGLLWITTRLEKKPHQALVAYLAITPITASLTFITPAANRSFNLVIPIILLASIGLIQGIKWVNRVKPISWSTFTIPIIVGLVFFGEFGIYLTHYYRDIPQEIAYKWHYGRRELVKKISQIERNYDSIVFSPKEGPAYIWLLFYKQYDSRQYWQEAIIDQTPNELGWFHIAGFNKYVFLSELDWETIPKKEKTLYVGYETDIPDAWMKEIEGTTLSLNHVGQVNYPDGQVAFKLVEIKKL